jgi:hypothetical protein
MDLELRFANADCGIIIPHTRTTSDDKKQGTASAWKGDHARQSGNGAAASRLVETARVSTKK